MPDKANTADGRHETVGDLLRRPAVWRRDRHLPVLVFVGADAAGQVAEQLVRPYNWKAPCAVVGRDELARVGDVPDLVELVVKGLVRRITSSLMPAPRFPMTEFLLWVAARRRNGEGKADGWAQAYKEWRRERRASVRTGEIVDYLSRALPAWVPVSTGVFAGLGRAVAVLEHITLIGPALAGGVASLVHVGLQATGWLAYRRFARHQDYFPRDKREPMGAYHRRLAEEPTDEQLDTLLVHAFCEDLRQAYQRRWPWPSWGRGVYCLLLVSRMSADPGAGGEHVAHRFIQLVHDERERTGQHVPLLVLTSSDSAPPVDAVERARVELSSLRARVRAWQRQVACPYLVVDAPEGAAQSAEPRPRLRWGRAALYWLVAALLVCGPVMAILRDQWDSSAERDRKAVLAQQTCGLTYVTKIGKECVGVLNDGRRTPAGVVHPALAPLVARIDDENAAIGGQSRYVSLVVLGEYSLAAGDVDSKVIGSRGELRSLADLQRDKHSGLRLRVLLANAGDEFTRGGQAARQIAELVKRDSSIAGVVGFARSTNGVREAIATLARAKIPMVGTTGSADDLVEVGGRATRYFFRVSPTNARQAALAARFARHRLLPGVAAPKAVIVHDESDGEVYTGNLAQGFAAAFEKESGQRPVLVPYTVTGGVEQAVAGACQERPDVYFYAGRSPEIRSFLNSLAKASCGERKPMVIAGDDITREAAHGQGPPLGRDGVDLYYTSLGDRRFWLSPESAPAGGKKAQTAPAGGGKPAGGGDAAVPSRPLFIARLLDEEELAGSKDLLADDNLILTYAAADLLHEAASLVHEPGPRPRVDHGDLLYQLPLLPGLGIVNRVIGVLDFDDTDRHDPVDAVIAVMRAGEGTPRVRCGRLAMRESTPVDKLCEGLPN
ncbi:ABC transporter substrate-binding protein [Nonomuraea zeae]|uniref:ABC transporter substrate-binding protein n=1 Tax=Nonomuraea zeae TaxID=1642303 RepID=A0A5S4G0G8_9ACTN|nr:ABC transporter substrate-binding protein [Nonomuraea zeae]TMR26525.1 hypothetical protein ETD85_42250 [Nonomuraea zeae]